MSRFKHDDQAEVALPEWERQVLKYEDVRYFDCEVSFAQVIEASHYRTTLGQLETTLADDRTFGLGLEGVDADCEHIVVTDRFGYGRCQTCEGHLWCAAWVADGLYGLAEPDGTLDYANTTARIFAERLPRLVLIGGAK